MTTKLAAARSISLLKQTREFLRFTDIQPIFFLNASHWEVWVSLRGYMETRTWTGRGESRHKFLLMHTLQVSTGLQVVSIPLPRIRAARGSTVLSLLPKTCI